MNELEEKRRKSNIDVDTWQDDAKEQPYLMPGTKEYEEYQRDLKEHDPFKEDDLAHIKFEEHNEAHSELLREKTKESITEPTSKRKYRNVMAKTTQVRELRKEAMERALKTETKVDDEKAKSRRLPEGVDKIIQNDGVTQDEFIPKALRKYE